MTKKIDARGLACPAPVLKTKETVEKECPGTIRVIVDNEAAGQNVSRFLESQNYGVSVEQKGNDFHIQGTQQGKAVLPFFHYCPPLTR